MQKMQETQVQSLVGKFPGDGNGNLLQYSCLENSMDKGAWHCCSPWGHKELYTTEHTCTHTHTHLLNIYNARSCKFHCEKVCKVSLLIITDVCECRERMKARLEESEILRGGNLKEGFSEEGIFEFRFKNESKLVVEELKEDDSRHRKEQVLRGKGHL